MKRNRKQNIRQAGRIDLIAILAAVWFVACAVLQVPPKTPDGVQCPLAPVQVVVKPLKAACGCVVGFKAAKHKPGDRGFVQCRCAEKKSAEHVAWNAPRNEALSALPSALEFPLPIVLTFAPPAARQSEYSLFAPPAFHPPALA